MTFKTIFKAHKWRFSLTFFLIFLEVALALLFPLFIGFAIDGALKSNYGGAIQLGVLGLVAMVVGGGRRVFDSRFYAKVYQQLGTETISGMDDQNASTKSARLGMIEELVEFMENSMPEIINNVIGLIGVVIIIGTINLKVFIGSLIATILILVIYWISSNRTIRLNKAYNDELENQVDIISSKEKQALAGHLKGMMKWNIKLSDLEALNFSVSWIIMTLFLVGSIIVAVEDGISSYGALFALIMYAFQYMESVGSLPLYYQNWLRLREIMSRLKSE